MAASAARFNLVVPSNVTFNPGDPITFLNNEFSPVAQTDITLLPGFTTIHLATGRYLINYSTSIFNASQPLKMVIFQDGNLVVNSFTGGPSAGGNGHVAGNTLLVVTAVGGSDIQLRVDLLGGPVTPFSNVTMIVTKLIETVV